MTENENGISEARNGVREGPLTATVIKNNEVINNNQVESKEQFEEQEYSEDNPEEYPEEYFYDNPAPCGLRERELLCPIMEEDNESTASGSIVNLAPGNNGSVIGEH